MIWIVSVYSKYILDCVFSWYEVDEVDIDVVIDTIDMIRLIWESWVRGQMLECIHGTNSIEMSVINVWIVLMIVILSMVVAWRR